ncbi:glucosaminidase domain-containing protein [uncultured Chloroflexus sp.]|uniref:glucosaminidase domain-containing protein n=1 Tax=uncultured Chloroflexus sp. TaxID=214040 RepID=UPI002618D251|nr:glucosaminidase domain-containing protein [uncultured Chloroflexus sp.]
MSAHSNRRRTRRLGQPLFQIEDAGIERAPAQPLAEMIADLDETIADRHRLPPAYESSEPIGLRVPPEVRAAFKRAQQSTRAVGSGNAPDQTARQPVAPPSTRNDPGRNSERSASAAANAPSAVSHRAARPATVVTATLKREVARTDALPAPPAQPGSRPITDNVTARQTYPARAATTSTVAEMPLRRSNVPAYVPVSLLPEAELPLSRERWIDPTVQAKWFNRPLVQVTIGLISLVVIALYWFFSSAAPILSFQYASVSEREAAANIALAAVAPPATGDYRLRAGPSLTPEQIDQILRSYGSPATGTGAIWYRLGLEYNIDPAYAVAFFIHESSAGVNPNWAGRKPDGSTTHNVGNIICAGYPTCYGRFRDYPNWETGIADWYRLIDVEYIRGRGLQTVAEVIPIYAPSIENDVQAYINVVTSLVDRWRAGQIP